MLFDGIKDMPFSNLVADCVFVVYRLTKCGFFDGHFKESDLEKVYYYLTRYDLRIIYDSYLKCVENGDSDL